MQKRSFIKAMLATTIIAGFAVPSFAQEAFDGPTAGPKAAEVSPAASVAVPQLTDRERKAAEQARSDGQKQAEENARVAARRQAEQAKEQAKKDQEAARRGEEAARKQAAIDRERQKAIEVAAAKLRAAEALYNAELAKPGKAQQ